MRLAGKVAIVTGAGRGIGRAAALALAREGANVVVVARSKADIDTVADECRALGVEAIAVETDVSQKADVLAMAEKAYAAFGKVDILVNNAGVALHDRIPDIEEEDFDRTYQVNTKGIFLCTQAVFGRMCDQGGGHIINVSSTAGKQGSSGFGSYAASKFAAVGFTQATHAEGQSHGVRASVVCPGPVDTVMRRDNHPNDIVENLTQPEEIADAIVFLACQSPRAHTPELIVRTPLRVDKG